ncbi:hypothetical protein AKJ37_01415 [candidate division MSBL1 archaeon SCGC-AAA259I09]|uniref:Uncharacterized protein n=5 Tax=candidate division MSBL1 TaxID=215777 RepID=A0A133UV68_9EURY|nr:hypothetical protein AKJ61_03960 [candidate division MSBL1 archaeon SCGC-AAA259B11]KXA90593.1 hypothetical protein AKJ62_00550 [candidate division MSBL1 archaeon SCGC-AAA259D14]KXA92279.1 hypothetical protein AKJ66_04420 [candidate division MSBL1 archaeon SCGC-AAA259E22]KXA96556.1 hypothetical protein AKJ39_04455 [candidate division MSBL1 archaeon SCGC-AAA259J03]KXA98092.1 hypothetical protein AKJ37_01415 [candidate division MSBL1 archaeon SCGC-AAA259I09]
MEKIKSVKRRDKKPHQKVQGVTMKQKAKISCKYENDSISKTIASAIQPDNLDSPEKVKIKTRQIEKRLESEIEVDGEIETLLNTLEDLLSCTSTAEKMI